MSGAGDLSGGVRRRHSASYHDDDLIASAPASNTPPYAIDNPQETTGDSAPASRTSAIENAARPAPTRLSSDVPPRVRFSTDIERPVPTQRLSLARNRASVDEDAQPEKDAVSKGRPGTPNLTIDTREVSPDGAGAPVQPSGSTPSHTSPLPPRPSGKSSPLSPKTRNRGLSMRSALFRKTYMARRNLPQQPSSWRRTLEAHTPVQGNRGYSITGTH